MRYMNFSNDLYDWSIYLKGYFLGILCWYP